MMTAFSDIVSDLVIVKSEDGSVYWPTYGINTIGDIIIGKGYQAKMSSDNTLIMQGSLIPNDFELLLSSGWNFTGYLHTNCYDASNMMSPVVDNLIIMKDESGSVYWPEFSLNTLAEMCPGKGYQIKMDNNVVFSYPSEGRFGFDDFNIIEKPIYYKTPVSTGNNMTIGIPVESWQTQPIIGDEIAAYDQSGRLIGSVMFNNENIALTVWGDDFTTNLKDGLEIGELVNFKLWDSNLDIEHNLIVTNWDKGSDAYNIDGISVVGNIRINTDKLIDKKLLKAFDVLGRETDKKGFILEMYNDGTVDKRSYIK